MADVRQNLQLKQSQTLALTPQLVQSIKLLQLNHYELAQEITLMLENNVMLQRKKALDDAHDAPFTEHLVSDTPLDDSHELDHAIDFSNDKESILKSIDAEVEWNNLYDETPAYGHISNFSQSTEDHDLELDLLVNHTSFDERLHRAIKYGPLSIDEQGIAFKIIGLLNENYFLTESYEEVAKKLNITSTYVQTVIEKIKHLDPAGVASTTIQECMLAQLHCLPEYNEAIGNAHDILSDYFNFIGHKDRLIARRLRLTEQEMDEAMHIIHSLSPYPNDSEENTHNSNLYPDVYIHQRLGIYYASLNEDMSADIEINEHYAQLEQDCLDDDEKNFICAQLSTAKFFLRALEQRNNTILRVSNAIAIHQQDFFSEGEKAMRPLTLAHVAKILDIHESTVSRAVNGKYCYFNNTLIELKYFFSHTLSPQQSMNTTHSVTSTQAHIKQLIEEENTHRPLRDTEIAELLIEKGMNISRRTVSKYREQLGIAKSSERKRKN